MVNYKSRIMNDTRRKKEKEKLTLQHDFFFHKKTGICDALVLAIW